MAICTAFVASSVLLLAAVVGLIVLHGGLEAIAAGVMIMAGAVFLGALVVFGASRDRTSGGSGLPRVG